MSAAPDDGASVAATDHDGGADAHRNPAAAVVDRAGRPGATVVPWALLLVVLLGALFVGTRDDRPRTAADRVDALSRGIKCPTCSGQSAAESDAPSSVAIREEIARLVREGRSDGEIRAHFADRYGRDILLTPESTGLGAVVWALPVTAGVVAAAGLGFALRRSRRRALGDDGGAGPPRRRWLWAAAVGVVAIGSGVAVASMAGERLPGEPSSGTAPDAATVPAKLARARGHVEQGDAVEAIKLYDEILAEDPEQVEALAYRGWLLHLAGLSEEAMPYLDRAVAADPTYPDAHFFRGFILLRVRNDPASAVTEFQAFLANDPPQELVEPVTSLLRQAQAAATSTTAP